MLLALCIAGCSPAPGGIKKESAASRRQDAARVHTDLGQQYLVQGRLELALEKLQKALSYDSSYVDAHTVIAVLYERIGDDANAEQHYRRAAQLRPKGGAELNNYGTFLCGTGRYDEAEGYFQRAVADPFYRTPAVALANSGSCLLKAGHRDAAEKVLRQALQRDPANAATLLQLAHVSYESGDYFSARGFMQRHEAAAPASADALMLGRNIELKLGDARGVGNYTRKLLQGFPESREAQSLNVAIQRDAKTR
ncbi:MAG: type IV pilus biogenesis/stability protein PilW [Xanthomonadales bacterium]|nr:type IV pilus biogenesis/stability protein PilW [Xanthomonadales bacterium]